MSMKILTYAIDMAMIYSLPIDLRNSDHFVRSRSNFEVTFHSSPSQDQVFIFPHRTILKGSRFSFSPFFYFLSKNYLRLLIFARNRLHFTALELSPFPRSLPSSFLPFSFYLSLGKTQAPSLTTIPR